MRDNKFKKRRGREGSANPNPTTEQTVTSRTGDIDIPADLVPVIAEAQGVAESQQTGVELGAFDRGSIERDQIFIGNADNIYEYPKFLFQDKTTIFDLIDYVEFEPVEYKPPYGTPISNPNGQQPIAGNGDISGGSKLVAVDNDWNKAYSVGDYKRVDARVRLPMPESVGALYANKWDQADLTYTGRMAIDIAYDMMQKKEKITSEAIANKIRELATDATVNMMTELAAAGLQITGSTISANGFFAGTLGGIPNPSVDLVFGLPSLRQFAFTYKLIALSDTDAETIRKIISLFKRNMYVSTSYSQNSKVTNKNRFLASPNMFRIKFMRGTKQNPVMFSLKICALEDMDVQYTPGGGYKSVISDNNFISQEITISLKLRENKILLAPDDFDTRENFTDNKDKVSH